MNAEGLIDALNTENGANCALVVGELVAPPATRTLPSGVTLLSFSLTVRTEGERTTSVPAVWYDPPKRALGWQAGEMVAASGCVVRRFYQVAGATGSATEVNVSRAQLLRHRAKAIKVIEDARSKLAA